MEFNDDIKSIYEQMITRLDRLLKTLEDAETRRLERSRPSVPEKNQEVFVSDTRPRFPEPEKNLDLAAKKSGELFTVDYPRVPYVLPLGKSVEHLVCNQSPKTPIVFKKTKTGQAFPRYLAKNQYHKVRKRRKRRAYLATALSPEMEASAKSSRRLLNAKRDTMKPRWGHSLYATSSSPRRSKRMVVKKGKSLHISLIDSNDQTQNLLSCKSYNGLMMIEEGKGLLVSVNGIIDQSHGHMGNTSYSYSTVMGNNLCFDSSIKSWTKVGKVRKYGSVYGERDDTTGLEEFKTSPRENESLNVTARVENKGCFDEKEWWRNQVTLLQSPRHSLSHGDQRALKGTYNFNRRAFLEGSMTVGLETELRGQRIFDDAAKFEFKDCFGEHDRWRYQEWNDANERQALREFMSLKLLQQLPTLMDETRQKFKKSREQVAWTPIRGNTLRFRGSGLFNWFVRKAIGSCVDYELESSSSSDELTFSMDDGFGVDTRQPYARDLLRRAQLRHKILEDESVVKAFYEAEKAHRGQMRASGDPYLQHCVETAILLADIGANSTVVVAGLLQDTLDDSFMSYDYIRRNFGAGVAELVEGVSKLSQLSKLAGENNTACKTVEADRLHTMFLAMADARAVLIKLAGRLHNMETLYALSPVKQQRFFTKETLEIFAPLANRLGISTGKVQFENLCFKHLYPQQHNENYRAYLRWLVENAKSSSTNPQKEIQVKREEVYTIALSDTGDTEIVVVGDRPFQVEEDSTFVASCKLLLAMELWLLNWVQLLTVTVKILSSTLMTVKGTTIERCWTREINAAGRVVWVGDQVMMQDHNENDESWKSNEELWSYWFLRDMTTLAEGENNKLLIELVISRKDIENELSSLGVRGQGEAQEGGIDRYRRSNGLGVTGPVTLLIIKAQ